MAQQQAKIVNDRVNAAMGEHRVVERITEIAGRAPAVEIVPANDEDIATCQLKITCGQWEYFNVFNRKRVHPLWLDKQMTGILESCQAFFDAAGLAREMSEM